MIDVTKDAAGVVHLTISGQIDSAQMREGLDKFLSMVGEDGPIDILYTASDITVPTAGALAVEMGYLPKLFGLLTRMRRVALVANQGWVRSAAKLESALIPGLSIRVFEPGQSGDARAYVAKTAEPAVA